MYDLDMLRKNLERREYHVSCFETASAAADYLDQKLDGRTIGISSSRTIEQLGLYDRLTAHNRVYWHLKGDKLEDAAGAEVYLCSVNGASQAGELVNIDGTGNRLAATLYGQHELYLVVGINKFTETLERAIWRARNIAAPQNAQRLGRNTPCAVRADRCYDCRSQERICRAMTILWKKPKGIPYGEVVLINQELGM